MDQGAHDGDEQDKHDRQLIELECEIDLEAACENPLVQILSDGARAGWQCHQLDQHHDGQHGRSGHGQHAKVWAPPIGASTAKEQDYCSRQGQRDQQRDQGEDPSCGRHLLQIGSTQCHSAVHCASPCVTMRSISLRLFTQCFSRLGSSMETERRVRKICTMIARPTTTSAAATTITKNAMT